jgi:hypothetical protein
MEIVVRHVTAREFMALMLPISNEDMPGAGPKDTSCDHLDSVNRP